MDSQNATRVQVSFTVPSSHGKPEIPMVPTSGCHSSSAALTFCSCIPRVAFMQKSLRWKKKMSNQDSWREMPLCHSPGARLLTLPSGLPKISLLLCLKPHCEAQAQVMWLLQNSRRQVGSTFSLCLMSVSIINALHKQCRSTHPEVTGGILLLWSSSFHSILT